MKAYMVVMGVDGFGHDVMPCVDEVYSSKELAIKRAEKLQGNSNTDMTMYFSQENGDCEDDLITFLNKYPKDFSAEDIETELEWFRDEGETNIEYPGQLIYDDWIIDLDEECPPIDEYRVIELNIK